MPPQAIELKGLFWFPLWNQHHSTIRLMFVTEGYYYLQKCLSKNFIEYGKQHTPEQGCSTYMRSSLSAVSRAYRQNRHQTDDNAPCGVRWWS